MLISSVATRRMLLRRSSQCPASGCRHVHASVQVQMHAQRMTGCRCLQPALGRKMTRRWHNAFQARPVCCCKVHRLRRPHLSQVWWRLLRRVLRRGLRLQARLRRREQLLLLCDATPSQRRATQGSSSVNLRATYWRIERARMTRVPNHGTCQSELQRPALYSRLTRTHADCLRARAHLRGAAGP